MKQILKSMLISIFSKIGGFPTRKTESSEVLELIRRLHPLQTDRPLIRLGPQGDGGYLIPDDLDGVNAIFSPGVSSISGFELDCANRNMDVFLADSSVEGPAVSHERFQFTKKFIGAVTNNDFITLDDWVNHSTASPTGDLMLQIDIEGFEYEVFLSISDKLTRRFRVIVAEFHWLDQLWSKPFFGLANHAFVKILQTHSCVHIHPNNYSGTVTLDGIEIPGVMEFTFLRNDRIRKRTHQSSFPHSLDCDNSRGPTVVLPRCWIRGE